MFEIILLIAATGGIATLARARGGKPWLWGTLTVVGYFLVPFLVGFFVGAFSSDPKRVKESAQLLFFVSAVSWVAILAFCARFLLGRGYAKPDGMWSCPNCKYLNKEYAVICEACQQPWRRPLPFT
jgi:hypothetical protein